jgi:4-amino-4-deoxy-L-arabinose transferase-like glycosyltransferase
VSESRRLEAGLLALALPVLFYGLGSYSLVNGDEGIYHYMARRMLESGNWLRLEFTGQERIYDTFTHAPLFFWAKALVIAVLGDSGWSMRILSAGLGWLSLAATFRLVEFVTGQPRAALLAGLVQLTSFQFVYLHSARTGEMETALTLAFTLAALFFLQAVRGERSFVAHHLCLVALLNLKLAIVAIPVLAELAYFAWNRSSRPHLRAWIATAAWLMPLGLLWHGYQVVAHIDSIGAVAADLLSQSGAVGFAHDVGFTGRVRYYVHHLSFGTLPWTFLYPVALYTVLRHRDSSGECYAWRLLACNAAAVAGFYLAIAIHHPWYWMPAIPFLSAFTGAALYQWTRASPHRALRLALGCAAAGAAWVELPILEFNPFAERAAHVTPDLELRGIAGAGPWVVLPVLCVAAFLALEGVARWSPAAVGATLLIGLLAAGSARVIAPLRFVDHRSSSDQLRERIDRDISAGRPVAFPLIVTEAGSLKARYYFGDDFAIRRLPRRRRAAGEFYRLEPLRKSQVPSSKLTPP